MVAGQVQVVDVYRSPRAGKGPRRHPCAAVRWIPRRNHGKTQRLSGFAGCNVLQPLLCFKPGSCAWHAVTASNPHLILPTPTPRSLNPIPKLKTAIRTTLHLLTHPVFPSYRKRPVSAGPGEGFLPQDIPKVICNLLDQHH